MNASRNRKLLTAVALAAGPLFAAGFASNAMATIQIQLTSGGFTTTNTGAGGIVSYSGTVGQWSINTPSGVSLGPGITSIDLSTINATAAAGAAPLTILLTDTGYTTPVSGFTMTGSGHIVGSGAGTATFDAYPTQTRLSRPRFTSGHSVRSQDSMPPARASM